VLSYTNTTRGEDRNEQHSLSQLKDFRVKTRSLATMTPDNLTRD
jgi:hypothetical protein